MLGLKAEANKPVKAALTLGDVAFGLEIARWRMRRLLNPSEFLRRIAGSRREAACIAKPSLLLIEVLGLTETQLRAALRDGAMPFLQTLLTEEGYELFQLNSREPQLAKTVREAESAARSPARANSQSIPPPFRWKPPAVLWAGVELAAGRGMIHVKIGASASLAEGQKGGSTDAWQLGRIDRTVRSLHRKAALSAVADYEVWIAAESQDGFALLPANALSCGRSQEVIEVVALAGAIPRVFGLPAGTRPAHSPADRPKDTLRVMTYNVHSCLGLDGKLAPSRIARIIRSFAPDVVALQEVDLKRNRSKGEDQAERLAGELEMHLTFCCTADRAWERYGHALLTRTPVTVITSGLFSNESQLKEPRGALLARIDMGQRSVYIVNTHFGLTATDRLRQAQSLLGSEWLGKIPHEAPVILCGDFNTRPGSLSYNAIASRFKDARPPTGLRKVRGTFPSPFPIAFLDYIFLSTHFEVQRVSVINNSQTRAASDHLPLVADLRLV